MTKFMEVNMFNMKKLIAVTIVSACMLSPLTSACAETITDESPCELPYIINNILKNAYQFI